MLTTPAAQNFALIVHELTTNAVKHGSLSAPQGRVEIHGDIDAPRGEQLLRFSWVETLSPPVCVPGRKGFGTSILNGLGKRFAQEVNVSWRPEGLVYTLRIPLDSIQASASRAVVDAASHRVRARSLGIDVKRLKSADAPAH